MKILYVIDGLGTGRGERSLAELQPALRRAGILSTIVCLRERRERGFRTRSSAPGWT